MDKRQVTFTRRPRSRHIRITIPDGNTVRVSHPWHVSRRTAEAFVDEKRSWIESQLKAVADRDETLRAQAALEFETDDSPETWKRRARAAVGAVIDQHGRGTLTPAGFRIRDLKSIWGSCGTTGIINLNWRLVLAPPAVLEYVVVHELCHLRHRNHSKAFWSLVEQQLPGYREPRDWLREHGEALMLAYSRA